MSGAALFLFVLLAGIGSQWLAWRLKLPAIVVLIAVGLILGPVSGLVHIYTSNAVFNEFVGLGVAIILFTGGMELKLEEFRRMSNGIKRLTILGPPIAWALGSLAAHYVAGLSWPASLVIGAILVVTGPTVILPLIRQAKLNRESTSLLRWEGIVNDPIGVLLAVLTFQYLTLSKSEVQHTLLGIGGAIVAAAVLGGVGAWLLGLLYRRGLVPEYLKTPVLLASVLAVYWASNLVQEEAGLLSVTVMGLVVGNSKLAERNLLQRFKDDLTTIILAILFIVIASRLEPAQLKVLDWRMALFVVALMFVVRPLTIWLATLGSTVRKADKWLLAWIAPRGIVAAATAGIFGPALAAHGYPDARKLLPIIFLVIIATVIAHGFSLRWFAGKLGLLAQEPNSNALLLVGSSPWSRDLAMALKKLGIEVLMVDGSYHNLQEARMENIDVYYGELLSEHAEHALELQRYNYLLCASDNDYYNALVCNAMGPVLGHHLTLQLPTHQEAGMQSKRLTLQRRGYFAFSEHANYEFLQQMLQAGWVVQTTPLTKDFSFDMMKDRICDTCYEWVLLGGITPGGGFRLYSDEWPFTPEAGWTVIYFAPTTGPLDSGENQLPPA